MIDFYSTSRPGIRFDIKINEADLREIDRITRGFPDAAANITTRVLNAVGTRARRWILQRLSKLMGLPQKLIRVWTIVGNRKATWRRQRVVIGISAWREVLHTWKLIKTAKGLRRAGKGSKTIPGAFFMKGSEQWAGPAFKRVRKTRLPIVKLRGPSAAQVAADDVQGMAKIEQRAGNEVAKETGKQLERWMKYGRTG